MTMDIQSLVDFCRSERVVLSYGSGRNAQILDEFLQVINVPLVACVISGRADGLQPFMDRVPIYCVKDYPVEHGKRYGVILALQEKYHADVKPRIASAFGDYADVYVISDDDIWEMFNYSKNQKRDRMLFQYGESIAESNAEYDEKINSIKKNYSKICIDYILMWSIGCGWSWMYKFLTEHGKKDGVFRLYYPIVWFGYEELESVNDEMLKRFAADDIEVISRERIDFWRYFIAKERTLFHVRNDYDVFSRMRLFNEFAVKGKAHEFAQFMRFTDNEMSRGQKFMRRVGLHDGFVAFCARDNLYKMNIRKLFFTQEASRAGEYRNTDVENFRLAMENLQQEDIQTVRMGAIAANEIDWAVDYAYKYRTEFLDIYLFSKCRFFVSNMSGIQALAQLFDKPLVCIDTSVLTMRNDLLSLTSRDRDLSIFARYWLPNEKRYLTISEMLEYEKNDSYPGINGCLFEYERKGIVQVKSTPDEINDVVQEMLMRLNGTMEYSKEDEDLQRRYWSIVNNFPLKNNFPFIWRIGAKFLRENRSLLE